MSTPPCENQAMNDNVMTVAGGGGRRHEPGGGRGEFALPVESLVGRKSRFISAHLIPAAGCYDVAMVNLNFTGTKARLAQMAAETAERELPCLCSPIWRLSRLRIWDILVHVYLPFPTKVRVSQSQSDLWKL